MAFREEEDYKVMERLRRRIEAVVEDPGHRGSAQAVLPVHVQAAVLATTSTCPTFNRPNVTLVDVAEAKGVERFTQNGIVANGVEYEVDCIIFASGFEISTEISRRYAIEAIEGRDGLLAVRLLARTTTRRCTG